MTRILHSLCFVFLVFAPSFGDIDMKLKITDLEAASLHLNLTAGGVSGSPCKEWKLVCPQGKATGWSATIGQRDIAIRHPYKRLRVTTNSQKALATHVESRGGVILLELAPAQRGLIGSVVPSITAKGYENCKWVCVKK